MNQDNSQTQSSINTSQELPIMGSLFERLVAVVIDLLLIGIVMPPFIWLFTGLSLLFILNPSNNYLVFYLVQFVPICTYLLLSFLYTGYFYTTRGQTIGKKVMKLKVVRQLDSRYLTWSQVFIREILGKFVSTAPMLLGYLWFFMSPKRQTWHDYIASTYVVKTDDIGNILKTGSIEYKKSFGKVFFSCIAVITIFCFIIFSIIGIVYLFGQSLEDPEYGTANYNKPGRTIVQEGAYCNASLRIYCDWKKDLYCKDDKDQHKLWSEAVGKCYKLEN